jgi:HNH endonuclease
LAQSRKAIPKETQLAVLTEAGWRCAVPTCRTILALDLHHLVEVSNKGGDDAANLLVLCPTCHALYHRGDLAQESLYTYKAILISLSSAFDVAAVDQLLFLDAVKDRPLQLQGQGVLSFMRLIAAGLARFQNTGRDMGVEFYTVGLTPKGQALIDAWKSGKRERVAEVLSGGMAEPAAIADGGE